MIRKSRPGEAGQGLDLHHPKTFQIDPVELQIRPRGWKGPSVFTGPLEEGFAKARALLQTPAQFLVPIIEITGQNQGLSGCYSGPDRLTKLHQLTFTSPAEEIEVGGHDVNPLPLPFRTRYHAVQEPATFKAVVGQIEILVRLEWKLTQNGVPMVSFRVNGILAIRIMTPDPVREEFELWPGSEKLMPSEYFLQADNIRPQRLQMGLHLLEGDPLIEPRKSLVNIESDDLDPHAQYLRRMTNQRNKRIPQPPLVGSNSRTSVESLKSVLNVSSSAWKDSGCPSSTSTSRSCMRLL